MKDEQQVDWDAIAQEIQNVAERAFRKGCGDDLAANNTISRDTAIALLAAIAGQLDFSTGGEGRRFTDGVAMDRVTLLNGESFRVRVFWERHP